jgi:major intracellular serine protease
MAKIPLNRKCKLPPVTRENIITIQEAEQKVGWNITAFDLPKLWNHSQGEGVTIAIIDTGCDLSHPDLKENLLPGRNFISPNKDPEDDNQHGTHVAGIVCAMNNDIGMVGVAPKCKVIPVKVLDKDGGGDLDKVAEGIRWAVDQNANILVMSLGSPNRVQEVRKAIQYASSKCVPVFVAAGNAGFSKEVFYPAAYPETIAIGSIDENFDRSKFSCTGKNLDFMAPGNKITSTVPRHWYATLSGTSMACPFAAGVAALMLSFSKYNKLGMPLKTIEDFREGLKKNTTPINNNMLKDKYFYQGLGIIDPRQLGKLFNGQ